MKTLKTISALFVLLFSLNTAFAQTAYEGKGDLKAQAGLIGWGNGTGLTGVVDYGLTDLFSVGGGAELYFGNSSNNFYLYGRGDLHLGKTLDMPKEMDLYPGLDLGVLGGTLGLGGHLGFRYFFTDKIGAYAELGSRGSLGVTINLN